MPLAYISIGSNINPRGNVSRAVRLLAEKLPVTGLSTVYRTSPELGKKQSDYYNCIVEVKTEVPPAKLQDGTLREIERELGRKRTKDSYASRTIDLDLIVYDGLHTRAGGITLPDPEIGHRRYLSAGLEELMRGKSAAAGPGIRALPGFTRILRKELFGHGKSIGRE